MLKGMSQKEFLYWAVLCRTDPIARSVIFPIPLAGFTSAGKKKPLSKVEAEKAELRKRQRKEAKRLKKHPELMREKVNAVKAIFGVTSDNKPMSPKVKVNVLDG